MSLRRTRIAHGCNCVAVSLAAALLATLAQTRVKKIVVEKKVSPAFDSATFGPAGQCNQATSFFQRNNEWH